MEGPFVAQVTEDTSSKKIRLTRDVIYGFTGRPPKNATHIEDLKHVIEHFPHPNLEDVNRHQDTGGTIPDDCDVWEKFTDWAQLSDEQKKETKEFFLMRYSVEDLQLAYDQHFVRKGKVPSSMEYRIFINNWRGNKTKRRTQSLAEMMRTIEQRDEEIYREREEQQIKSSELDLVTHIYNGQLRHVQDLENENSDLRNTVHRLESENEQEREDKDHFREISEVQGRHVYQLRKTITEKDRQLCEKCTRNRELEDAKDEYQGVIKRQRLMIKEKKEENKGLKGEVGVLNGRMEEVNHRNEELNNRMEEVNHTNEELNNRMEEVNHTNEELNNRNEELNNRMEEVNHRMEEVNHRNEELNNKVDDLNNNNEELNNRNVEQSATINEQSATINEQSTTINEQSATINEQSATINEQSATINGLSDTVYDLIEQNQDKSKTITELIGHTKQLADINGSKTKTINDLKSENDKLKSKLEMEVHMRQTYEQMIAEQSQKLEKQKALIEEQNEKLAKNKEDKDDLRKQMERQDEINRDLYDQLADVRQLCGKLMRKIQNKGEK